MAAGVATSAGGRLIMFMTGLDPTDRPATNLVRLAVDPLSSGRDMRTSRAGQRGAMDRRGNGAPRADAGLRKSHDRGGSDRTQQPTNLHAR